MCSPKVFKDVVVKVKSSIGNEGYAFFTTKEYGDVFVHLKDLAVDGFSGNELVVGHQAVIDIVVEASGKQYTGRIHEINCRAGRPISQNISTIKQSPSSGKKSILQAGVSSQGKIKILNEGYGFIQKHDYRDLFFPLNCVSPGLGPFLKLGVDVCFDVEVCERGVMARVTDIVWMESQLKRELVDVNKEKSLYIHRVTNPLGQNRLEIRDGAPEDKSKLIAEPKTLAAARTQIENGRLLHLVLN